MGTWLACVCMWHRARSSIGPVIGQRRTAGSAPQACARWAQIKRFGDILLSVFLIAMSVKVINHIYYGADDIPKTRSPTQLSRRLPDERSSADDVVPGPSASRAAKATAYWPPTPSSMPSSPESPKTRRERQRASMRKDVLGDHSFPKRKALGSMREEVIGGRWGG
jgi:hypothetical protein